MSIGLNPFSDMPQSLQADVGTLTYTPSDTPQLETPVFEPGTLGITIRGTFGTGKTTVAVHLAMVLRDLGFDVHMVDDDIPRDIRTTMTQRLQAVRRHVTRIVINTQHMRIQRAAP